MILSTGDIKQDYDVIDVVFWVQVIISHFSGSGGGETLKTLKFLPETNRKLEVAGEEIGADIRKNS